MPAGEKSPVKHSSEVTITFTDATNRFTQLNERNSSAINVFHRTQNSRTQNNGNQNRQEKEDHRHC